MNKNIQVTVAILFKLLNDENQKATGFETFETSYLEMDEVIDSKLKQLSGCIDKFRIRSISYCLGNVSDNVSDYISSKLSEGLPPELQEDLMMKRYTAVGNLVCSMEPTDDIYERCLTGYGSTFLVTRQDELEQKYLNYSHFDLDIYD